MKVLSQKIAYECPILRVEKRKVLTGKKNTIPETHYVVVRQPNIGVTALTKDKKVVCIRERRGKKGIPRLDLPAGKMTSWNPTKQELEQQALHELEEEAGYTAKNIALMHAEETNSSWFERTYYHFAAWNIEQAKQKLEAGEEIEEVILLPIKTVQKIANGTITKIKTKKTNQEITTAPFLRQDLARSLAFFKKKRLL